MKFYLKVFTIVLSAWMLMSQSTLADELTLENGDRVSGKVVRMQDGKLLLENDYSGKMTIDWDKVVYMKTDAPLPVLLNDGSRPLGQVFVRGVAAEKAGMETEDAAMAVDMDEVKGINTEPKPPVKITAKANAGFSRERGNTDNENWSFDAEFIARTAKHRFTVGGEFNREDTDSRPSSRNWRAIGKYDYFLSEKWFLYGGLFFVNDEFADLNLRSTYSVGVGHQFFESKKLNLSASAGVSYVTEDFIVAADDEFAAGQWIIRYDQFFFDDRIQLFHDDFGTISLEDSDKWSINTRQGLRFPFYKRFFLTLQYNYDYDNRPSPAAKSKWDSKMLLLLGYQFEN
jgi:putative salt-induced outer membrane protein YdiY